MTSNSKNAEMTLNQTDALSQSHNPQHNNSKLLCAKLCTSTCLSNVLNKDAKQSPQLVSSFVNKNAWDKN